MIYCNKRKKDIKPEVGQVWVNKCGKVQYTITYVDAMVVVYQDTTFNNKIPDSITTYLVDIQCHPNLMNLHTLKEEAPKPQSPWQPIETAPKDGTRILVADGGGRTHIAWFDGWKFVEFECDDDWFSKTFYEEELTAWMPLPYVTKTEDKP